MHNIRETSWRSVACCHVSRTLPEIGEFVNDCWPNIVHTEFRNDITEPLDIGSTMHTVEGQLQLCLAWENGIFDAAGYDPEKYRLFQLYSRAACYEARQRH
jgi:hypothetical protein